MLEIRVHTPIGDDNREVRPRSKGQLDQHGADKGQFWQTAARMHDRLTAAADRAQARADRATEQHNARQARRSR
jgi:hypothetical protein